MAPYLPLLLPVMAVIVGGVSQRATGIGFSLIATPVLVLTLGPLQGIVVVSLCAAATATITALQVWRSIEWHRYLQLALPGVIAVPIGVGIAAVAEMSILQVAIGVTVMAAIILPGLLRRHATHVGMRTTLLAGFLSGLMNSIAGVGGPALTAYAFYIRWPFDAFRATVQPVFMSVGIATFTLKVLLDPRTPMPGIELLLILLAGTAAGNLLGGLLARRLPARLAHLLVKGLALAGAAVIVVEAVLGA